MAAVCVYCSSSNAVVDRYGDVAADLGQRLAAGGHPLIYGGGNVGLMGILARAVHDHGGSVVGIIPDALKSIEGVAYEVADELIVTNTMQERKRHMFTRAEAFVVLPGGFGTLEEFLEVLTLKQLRYHTKPIVVISPDGFYDLLEAFFEQLITTRFARESIRTLYHLVPSPEAALAYLDTYVPTDPGTKVG